MPDSFTAKKATMLLWLYNQDIPEQTFNQCVGLGRAYDREDEYRAHVYWALCDAHIRNFL